LRLQMYSFYKSVRPISNDLFSIPYSKFIEMRNHTELEHQKMLFAVEIAFTEVYKKHQLSHPAIRESECIAAMFPAAFSRIEAGDHFAGRWYGTPGVGKPYRQHNAYKKDIAVLPLNVTTTGFTTLRAGWAQKVGYFCDTKLLRTKMEEVNVVDELRPVLEEIIAFWQDENMAVRMRKDYPEEIAQKLPFDTFDDTDHSHPAYPLYRLTGPMLDYGKLVTLGIVGLKEQIVAAKTKNIESGELYSGMLKMLDLLENCCTHFIRQASDIISTSADDAEAARLNLMVKSLEQIAIGAPQTLHQAIQLVLLYNNVACAYSFGRMDIYLGNFLANDLKSGVLTETTALEMLSNLWEIIDDCGAPFDNRIIIGGKGRPNEAQADAFALLAIAATRNVRRPLPQLSLRFYEGQNPELYAQGLVAIGEGCTFPMLYNDEVNIPSFAHASGVSIAESEQYVPYGCGEYVLYKSGFGTPSGFINMTKVLETTLRNGIDPLNGNKVGVPCGDLASFTSFDQLLAAFKTNVEYWVAILAKHQKFEYDYANQNAAFLFYSMLYDDCIESGLPVFGGGIKYLGGTLESYGQINAADALTAIKKCVFDDKSISSNELLTALNNDFEGYEPIRRQLMAAPKYGNDETQADEMQQDIHEHICNFARNQAEKVGLSSYLIVIINNLMNTVLGRITAASADGRKLGDYLANANNPIPGMDKHGITACLNSLSKLDATINAGVVQNIKFNKSMFKGDRIILTQALLGGYFRNGGTQAMITVTTREELEAARINPEQYAHVLVRVGGFSARYVDLPADVQLEILNRTVNE